MTTQASQYLHAPASGHGIGDYALPRKNITNKQEDDAAPGTPITAAVVDSATSTVLTFATAILTNNGHIGWAVRTRMNCSLNAEEWEIIVDNDTTTLTMGAALSGTLIADDVVDIYPPSLDCSDFDKAEFVARGYTAAGAEVAKGTPLGTISVWAYDLMTKAWVLLPGGQFDDVQSGAIYKLNDVHGKVLYFQRSNLAGAYAATNFDQMKINARSYRGQTL